MLTPDTDSTRTTSTPVPAFVATTGGHLVQLSLMAPVLEPERHENALWITHRTPQSESMLAGRDVMYVPTIRSRDFRNVARSTPSVLRELRRHSVDTVYSTGAAIALAALPGARLAGARPRYIESLARSTGPSLAGKVLQLLPWVPLYTQYPQNARGRWRYDRSLLDSFDVEDAGGTRVPRRVFITLGTARPWQFRRLVERMIEILPEGTEAVWQTGATDVADLPIDARPMLSDEEFRAEIERADVVVTHSGCGTFIRCLEAGKIPIMVPRRAARQEHVDDHQVQIAAVAQQRGLALSREVDDLTAEDLRHVTGLRARPADPLDSSTSRQVA
ncbi:glycosyltransferase [Cellulomonas bogoriensis]|uniref:Glycosyltransferase n=1 Tax=Cellulomonas bogoriensis 69B4 = DSM 16987 TaxID=1386082 RepID=A0A0A0BUU5_9CELL|nr:glycosyltransferase [Cellulomonas bogoriensis]KGM12168.1 glycosyltransferase [Cellulomonas bogoriensis 69B4 = DSM 16987]